MRLPKELPTGWAIAALEAVCHLVTDGTHKTPNYTKSGIRFISIKNIRPYRPIDWNSYERYISKDEHAELTKRCKPEKGDILFPRIGTLGFAKRIDFDQEVSIFVGLGLAKPDKQIVDERYLEAYLNTPRIANLSIEKANGSGRLTLPLEESRKFPVLLAPQAEQRRIVAKIEELFSDLDASVVALGRARANLKRYRAAVLKAAVEGKLTAEWRKSNPPSEPADKLLERILAERRKKWEQGQLARHAAQGKEPPRGWTQRYEEPSAPETPQLAQLPEGWCWASLAQLGFLDRGKSRHRPRNAAFLFGGAYPFIQTGQIGRSETFIREYSQTYSEAGLLQSRLWPRGTLCITIAANIAETGILDFDACFPDSVVGFLPASEQVLVRYVELYLRTMQAKLESLAPATAQKNINLDVLQQIAICLPPLAEQLSLVQAVDQRLSLPARIMTQSEHSLTRSTRLRQSILKRAFEGKLVPQDPNDEPASALLERIRAARTSDHPSDMPSRTRKDSGEQRQRRAENGKSPQRGKKKPAKRNVFAELSEGFDALKRERDD